MERSRHFEGMLILLILIGISGLYLWQNSQPASKISVPPIGDTPIHTPTSEVDYSLREQLAAAGTPTPTADETVAPYASPTLPPSPSAQATLVGAGEIQNTPLPTPTPAPATTLATIPGPTPYPSPTQRPVILDLDYEPPPAQGPLRLHVDDHYWFKRPVDASANSASIFYYAFGSNGLRDDMRVHHGVDMPNDVGVPIHAAYAGKVTYAGLGAEAIGNNVDIYPSYGNVVIVEHDDGFKGQTIWTLYAHMSELGVGEGEHVEAGDVLGKVGATGDVSGSHVHMEVRIGENSYWYTYNPLLWLVPQTGTGVVAGRVTYPSGAFVDDTLVTLIQDNRTFETTTTYVDPYIPDARNWHVRPDPAWQENFVMGDIPEGTYEITATVGGRRISREITVRAGTTNFVVLSEGPPPSADTDDTVS